MSRLLVSLFAVCCLVAGCTSGTDESLPPTMRALNQMEDPSERESGPDLERLASPDVSDVEPAPPPGPIPPTGEYQVEFITTGGKFLVDVNREWSPIGAHRFYRLVKDGFYDDAGFFRVVPGFVVQFGLAADPAMTARWKGRIQDEPVLQGNRRGYLTFAKSSQPNSRTTQVFISYSDNPNLDSMGFSAFGRVTEGMDVVDRINPEYGEKPQQHLITAQGNAYLNSRFPKLDYIQTARVIKDDLADDQAAAQDAAAAAE